MALKPEIEKLLRERYYLEGEKSWKEVATRVGKIHPKATELIEKMKFIPSSPTLMNANTGGQRLGTLSSCFPMEIKDSINGIYREALADGAIVTKYGGGVGYDFSVLRSSKEKIKTLNRHSSGPLSFISSFSIMLDEIRQGGVRRGAGMAMLNVDHPDILKFVEAKKNYREKRYERLNFSVKITDDFYKKLHGNPDSVMQVKNVTDGEYSDLTDSTGKPVTVKQLWDRIIHFAWLSAEPGIFNSTIAFEQCTTTNLDKTVISNPCQEFTNIPFSSCNLGSMNVMKYINHGKFDWEQYGKDVATATKFLDKVIDNNKFPIEKIEVVTKKIRPIGLGFMGLADLLYSMKMPFNHEDSYRLAKEITRFTTLKSMQTSVELAKKHGTYPSYNRQLFIKANKRFFENEYENLHGIKVSELLNEVKEHGVRNSCFTSLAPTGSISYLANVSSQGEPNFGLVFGRKIEKLEKQYETVFIVNPVFEKYLKNYTPKKRKEIIEHVSNNNGSCQKCGLMPEEDKKIFVTASDLTPMEHLEMLSVLARNTSLSVSKTINLPEEATEEQVSEVYLKAHERGVIGVTVYRDKCREGILINKANNGNGKIVKTQAPKRPPELRSDVHHFIIKKHKYYVAVGLFEDEPYEIFTGLNYTDDGEVFIPKDVKEGLIIKEKRGSYMLAVEEKPAEGDNDAVIGSYLLTNSHSDDNADALTRMISTSLRHGVDISFIVHQLEKTKGDMVCFAKSLARALKHYIKDGTKVYGENCPSCKNSNLIRKEGCLTCPVCGFSRCS